MSRVTGEQYEKLAAEFLEKQGLSIASRNFRSRFGEIDIIATDKHSLIFAEVKFRKTSHYGEPFAFVDHKKQQRLIKTALGFMQQHKQFSKLSPRFDVISIQPQGPRFDIQWIQNAFTTDGF